MIYVWRDNAPSDFAGSAVALGNFDGLHLGHKEVIMRAVALARKHNKRAAVLTFEPHPRRVIHPAGAPTRLLSFRQKIELLDAWGVEILRVVRFTRTLAQLSAGAFVENILVREMKAASVVTGDDFVFGHNRSGNAASLAQMGARYGFEYNACAPVLAEDERCSSSRIRTLLGSGEVAHAAKLLGRPYSISAHIVQGQKRGSAMGYPTANMIPPRITLPAKGIYAVRMKVDGEWKDGAASLGVNPTFDGSQLTLETFLFDWQGSLYGKRAEVAFIDFIRPEEAFTTVEALKAQIARDCVTAKQMLVDCETK